MNVCTYLTKLMRTLCLLLFLTISTECRRQRRNRALCSGSRIDIQSGDGVKIEPVEQSHVYVGALSQPFEDGHHLKFEFKTTSANATLFYAVRDDEYDMVSIGIREGRLQFQIRCRMSHADLTFPGSRVDDGKWHKIKFQRKHRKGIFMLDDAEFFEQYYVGCGGFTSINFGSTHPDHHALNRVSELKDRDGIMSGCLRKLEISTGMEAPPHYVAVSQCT